jgi:hypothetical protein
MDAVLLIHPPQSFSNKRQKGAIGYSAPVGLLHLATALKRSGHPVYVVDMDTSCIGLEDIFKIIDEKEISVLGVSIFTRTRNTSYYILEKISLYSAVIHRGCNIFSLVVPVSRGHEDEWV